MTQFPDQQPQYGQQLQYGQQPGYPPFPGSGPVGRARAPRLPVPGWLLAGAGVGAAVGAVLPWATFGPLTKAGTEADGAITLVMGLVIAAAGIWIALRAPLAIPIVALVLSALVAVIAVIDLNDVNSKGLDVGSGLWLTLGAGALSTLAGIWALAIRPAAKSANGARTSG